MKFFIWIKYLYILFLSNKRALYIFNGIITRKPPIGVEERGKLSMPSVHCDHPLRSDIMEET